MTNREKFLALAENDVDTLRKMSDENFVDWMCYEVFHWSAIFHLFAWKNGYPDGIELGDKKALSRWLSEQADDGEVLGHCPNCGYPAMLKYDTKKGWWVECYKGDAWTGYCFTKKEAVEKWNKFQTSTLTQ